MFFFKKKKQKNSTYGEGHLLTSFGLKVRSKSEIIIAEKLYEKRIPFQYEKLLIAQQQKYIPDFTVYVGGRTFYWEHFGLLSNEEYAHKTKIKMEWYAKHFPQKLICTCENPQFALQVRHIIEGLLKFM